MDFKEQVKRIVKDIPSGQTLTYKEVARKAGQPKAQRLVASILSKNHNHNIPCHRVIKSDGSLGGFNQGVLKKAHLLYTEGYNFPSSKVLDESFFKQDSQKIAKSLIGKFLVKGDKALIISEVEVYSGKKDLASHASKGKTKRTAPMFGKPGIWYVYLVYGVYYMLNIVTEKKGFPAAILIRATFSVKGPGKLTKHLKIDKSFNNKPAKRQTGLWIEDRGIKPDPSNIKALKRVGIDYAKEWKDKLLRFKYLKN
ncbi:MAG TPA: DNA-3-methyladenine glycosylase [Patescibacteria group bacterium]|nr:DNA-3-methyladenine glycosylase [Patescibacteria group bacterium]